MTARTHMLTTARLIGWCTPGAAALGLLLGACAEDIAPILPDTSASAPAVLDQSITGLTSDAGTPPSMVPLVGEPPLPNTPLPIVHGALSVVQQDELIELRLGDRVHVAGTGWTIRFAQVLEDSRCPADAQCIWAGQVAVRVLGEHSDGRVAALALTLGGGHSGAGLLGDLPLQVVSVEPLRLVGSPPPDDYTLHVRLPSLVDNAPGALSGLRGMVTLGPMCPVVRVEQPCPDRPYSATMVIRDAAGRVVTRVTSGVDGTFILPLPVGSYVLEPTRSDVRLPSAGAYPFRVQPEQWTALDVRFDSGIR